MRFAGSRKLRTHHTVECQWGRIGRSPRVASRARVAGSPRVNLFGHFWVPGPGTRCDAKHASSVRAPIPHRQLIQEFLRHHHDNNSPPSRLKPIPTFSHPPQPFKKAQNPPRPSQLPQVLSPSVPRIPPTLNKPPSQWPPLPPTRHSPRGRTCP